MKGTSADLRRLLAQGAIAGPPVRLPAPTAPAADLPEEPFTQLVIDLAHAHGWLAYHTIPLRTKDGYRTGTQGDPGFMDLVLARAGEMRAAELKAATGRVKPDQQRWVRESGASVWRPADWDLIVATLE